MKKLFFTILGMSLAILSNAQENHAVFLHHSTGGNVYSEGNVPEWISDYNLGNGTDFSIEERSYPDSPWGWSNYAYDYWKLWIDGSCDNVQPGIECIGSIAEGCELVIFKHCFPGASIGANTGNPDVSSSSQTIENYQAQYRALRQMMDTMPETKFMLWTLAPLHRLSTSADVAARAGEFVDWVKNDFLTEDSQDHPNIYIFDFFGLVAEQSASPTNGVQYCLKYEYERSHDGDDSHPNTAANEYAGPHFARAVVNALGGDAGTAINEPDFENELQLFPNPVGQNLSVLAPGVSPLQNFQVFTLDGRLIKQFEPNAEGVYDVSFLGEGMYLLKVVSNGKLVSKPFIRANNQ
ncbi:MAG: T9SS type A sorting domain-containing protein [Bacteroidota bacterium]|nr:MAG: T9SS type A sorting domain-containing protein [Bacteroidota bacterium]